MNLDLARWQFGITTVYHFLFVPLTIGLSLLVAGMQTAWVRTGNDRLPAADQVLGQALPDQLRDGRGHRHRAGVPVRHELERLLAGSSATSSVRRWRSRACSRSSSSRRSSACGSSAGTGCPRSCTSRASGWPRSAPCCRRTSSSPRTPGCSTRSATVVNTARGRAELTDFGAVLTNSTAVGAFPHTITACVRDRRACSCSPSARGTCARGQHTEVMRPSLRMALVTVLIAGIGVVDHRRPAGQADDRAAADEDGRRRGALRHHRARVVLAVHHRLARRDAGDLERPACPACCRSWPPAPSTARSRASTTLQQQDDAGRTGPATTCRSSRSPTGRSG